MRTDQSAPEEVAQVAIEEINYGVGFARRHGWKMALWFFLILMPLWGFAAVVGELHENEVFAFDPFLLNLLHHTASPGHDRFFVLVSKLGYLWGVIPLDVAILLWLAATKRFRPGLFFGVAVIGSAILNIAAKMYFARVRPDLWLSIAPETSYSFPSGHAMGSATLATALILLCWHARARWPVVIVATSFALLVSFSRIYLGVHFPSDILAGWLAAIAWVVGVHELIIRRAVIPES
ncbi:MAG: phosphatase PAP2 family protein [Lysobacteraceae bacterium]